jgi:hypothetical protein
MRFCERFFILLVAATLSASMARADETDTLGGSPPVYDRLSPRPPPHGGRGDLFNQPLGGPNSIIHQPFPPAGAQSAPMQMAPGMGNMAPGMGNICITPYGGFAGPLNPLGSPCYVTLPMGMAQGYVGNY